MTLKPFVFSALALSLGTFGLVAPRAHGALQQGPPPAGMEQGPGAWDAPPAEFREMQRKGFHDGVEAARGDFDHHRWPGVEQHDVYRHPHVPRDMREDFREGFRRGYERAKLHLMSEPDHR